MDRGPFSVVHTPPSIQSMVPVGYYTYRFYDVDTSRLDSQGMEGFLKEDLSISAQGRLCRLPSSILLESEELARQYHDYKIRDWRKKWGENTRVIIIPGASSSRRDYFKVLEHSDTVKRRLKLWK